MQTNKQRVTKQAWSTQKGFCLSSHSIKTNRLQGSAKLYKE